MVFGSLKFDELQRRIYLAFFFFPHIQLLILIYFVEKSFNGINGFTVYSYVTVLLLFWC